MLLFFSCLFLGFSQLDDSYAVEPRGAISSLQLEAGLVEACGDLAHDQQGSCCAVYLSCASMALCVSVELIGNASWHKKPVKQVSYKWSVTHKSVNKNEEKYSVAKAVSFKMRIRVQIISICSSHFQ